MTIEQRVEALEKEVAALKEQVSKLPVNANLPKISEFMEFAKKFSEISSVLSQQGVACDTLR